MKKKITAFTLVMLMMLALLPGTASADTHDNWYTTTGWDGVANGDTLVLASDFTGEIVIPDTITVLTIDGGGHALTGVNITQMGGAALALTIINLNITAPESKNAIKLIRNGTLNIQGICSVAGGSTSSFAGWDAITAEDSLTVNVPAGAALATTGGDGGSGGGYGLGLATGDLVINNYGTIIASGGDGGVGGGYGLSSAGNDDIIINNYGTIIASGGKVSGVMSGIGISASEGDITLSGTGSLTVMGGLYGILAGHSGNLTINDVPSSLYIEGGVDVDGTYTNNTGIGALDGLTTAGAVFNYGFVCENSGTRYETLAAALDAAATNDSIVLLASIDLSTTIAVENKSVTLDLNGQTLTVTPVSGDALRSTNGWIEFYDSAGGGECIINGNVSAISTGSGDAYGVYANSGAAVTVNGNVSAISTGSGDARGAYAVGATVTVNGNVSAISDSGNAFGVAADGGAEVTIEGTITVSGGIAEYISFAGTTIAIGNNNDHSREPDYFGYTDSGNAVWVRNPLSWADPTIENLSDETRPVGYAAFDVEFAVDGIPMPTVTKVSGNAAITVAGRSKLQIAAGLPVGTYPVVLKAENAKSDAAFTFTFTVTGGGGGDGGGGEGSGGGGGGGSSIIVNTVPVSYSVSEGVISSALTAQTLRDIVDNGFVREDGSRAVKLDYSAVTGANMLMLDFDASLLKSNEDIVFIIETPFGTFVFTAEQMREWLPDSLGRYTIALEKSSLRVNIKKDGRSAEWDILTPMARIGVPYAPETGENTDNLVVTDKNGRILPTSVYESGMVCADVFDIGTYKAAAAMPAAFTDTAGHWAEADIDYVALRGLLSADGEEFMPGEPITRADFITALAKLAGADVIGYTVSRYSDVSGAAMPYIEWASEMEIVFGVGDGLFQPQRSITREEMAVMMYRFADVLGYPLPVLVEAEHFGDASRISDWASRAVADMQLTGIVVGMPGGVFDPKGTFTRAESAAVLHRFIELVISSRDAEGWSNDNRDLSRRVYYTRSGTELTGWQELAGKWYYFGKDGVLAVNTTIDGYEIDADGARK